MDWKKWAIVIGLLVFGTLLLPRGNQGILGIAFYMIAMYTLLDQYQHEMNQYMKAMLSLLGSSVLTYIVVTILGFFTTK